MRRTLLASVSVAVLGTSAAMAAAPMAPAPTWTGFYVGLNAGYAWGSSDPSQIASGNLPPLFLGAPLAPPPDLSPHGFIGGGQVGYNWQTGAWVFGAEVDFSGIDAKADATISPFFAGKGGRNSFTWSSRYDWLFTARVRGGYLVMPNWLLYVTGGLAVTHVKDNVTCTPASGGGCGDFIGGDSWNGSSTLAGGTFGGGIETMLAPNWTARAEYLYAKFKDTTPIDPLLPPFSSIPVPALFSFQHSLNIVRFSVNYKFGP